MVNENEHVNERAHANANQQGHANENVIKTARGSEHVNGDVNDNKTKP